MGTTEGVDMASSSSRSTEVFIALTKLKRRIREQHQEGALTCDSGSERLTSHSPSKELRDSLVNMYRDNPGVNEELRLRLPPPIREQLIIGRSDNNGPSPLCEDMKSSEALATPHPDRIEDSVGPAPRTHLEAAVDSPPKVSVLKHLPTLDRDKNISFLLKELDALRQTNNRLQEQILRKEVDEVLQEEQKKKKTWEEPAALMMELLSNQKSRDQALMSRLLLANEERDEALLRVDRLQQLVQRASDDPEDSPEQDVDQDLDQDVDRLLQRICTSDSALEVQQVGSLILQRLQSARQRRDDIITQEMKAVIDERDGSVATWKRLLQEVEQRPTEEQLLALQRERDIALVDQRRVKAELQALQANQMSAELTCNQTPPNQHEVPPLLHQLQQLSLDKQSLEAALRRSQEEEQQANDRVQRLERLVEVLRKKVGGGNLRPLT